VLLLLLPVVDGVVALPFFLHVRMKQATKAAVVAAEEAVGKTVSSVVGVGLRSPCLNLCKIVVVVVLVDDEEVGIGYGIGEDENEILGLLGFLLLGLLHVLLNLESDFEDEDDEVVVVVAAEDDDDDDDSCEDPESDPCCDFPLPAFNEALHLFLMGC